MREGMPMMPPPLHDVTAPMDDLADEDGEAPESGPERHGGEAQRHPHPGEAAGDPGRKRRRRGRRGGRRRRRNGEPGQEGAPAADDHHGAAAPIAEQVEYVPMPASREEAAPDMAAAIAAAAVPADELTGAESLPVRDYGDPLPAAPSPAPRPPPAAEAVPAREDAGAPANPKRGWWRRVVDC